MINLILTHGLPVALCLGLIYWSVLSSDDKPPRRYHYIAPERQVVDIQFTKIGCGE